MVLLASLPRGWSALRASWQLIDAGRNDSALINYTQDLCDEFARGGPLDVLQEREECLVRLAVRRDDPVAVIETMRADAGRKFFPSAGPARALAQLEQRHLSESLRFLGLGVQGVEDLPTLLHWLDETVSWRSYLIARVYARAFDRHRISRREATELCRDVLTGLRSGVETGDGYRYDVVYGAVLAYLNGKGTRTEERIRLEDAIGSSHRLAIEILKPEYLGDDKRLYEMLKDRRGWWRWEGRSLKNGMFGVGSHCSVVYYFPAIRLAMVALTNHDLASSLIDLRQETMKLLSEHNRAFREPFASQRSFAEAAAAEFRAQVAKAPDDELLFLHLGDLELRLGNLAEAETALNQCLALSTCRAENRAGALYDLACVMARTGRLDVCRNALEEAELLRPSPSQHLTDDPDLEAVRDQQWFRELVERSANR